MCLIKSVEEKCWSDYKSIVVMKNKHKMRRSVKKEKMLKPKRMSEIRNNGEKESSCLSVTRQDHNTSVTQQKTKYPRILFRRSDRTRQSEDKIEKLSRSEKSQRQLEEDENNKMLNRQYWRGVDNNT
ncbi:hypothetical protein EIN_240550 [Entamoeba invadens IP1]|uniref:Uncharacterized protein n=1 Tax=Entamoeba invadens IP1 TaxID=370355 RepID=A0A0A1TUP2_ENTIV|nr:hypothetical protein EIN_240550 [Entamoeba invadens IP1]ELP83798.1 hypothetical protein EIN_240550 [Entamoeba invadens IP1]|eukprot:XP_004183144.1 hypothetical protein EIN_240550 [Entamoeba invadens IP1]